MSIDAEVQPRTNAHLPRSAEPRGRAALVLPHPAAVEHALPRLSDRSAPPAAAYSGFATCRGLKLGVMQGRLLPPVGNRLQAFPALHWREEFALAAQLGITGIELIYEAENEPVNPLSSDFGAGELYRISRETGVRVLSVCADYFMTQRLVHTDGWGNQDALRVLQRLIARAATAGAAHVVLPFVDAARLRSSAELAGLRELLSETLPTAEAADMALHLEMDLSPCRFSRLLSECNHPLIRATLDTGNSASLGFDPNKEVPLLGPWLGSVHIKDRRRGGGSVPLGTGHTAFATIFHRLQEAGYRGTYILQAARGATGDELNHGGRNARFVIAQAERAGMITPA